MDSTNAADGDGLPAEPTVASMLGLKLGSLRFRRHGSTQKAHVVLRRVELSDPTNDDVNAKPTVYFSLFAQKRIEVKPGKEIFLTVSSVDGRFKDQPIIFGGDLADSDGSEDEENTTQVAEEEEVKAPLVKEAIPPKMRRTWTKRFEEVSPARQIAPVIHSSIGVQAQPELTSVSVEASPSHVSKSVQAEPALISSFTQVDHSISPLRSSSAIQTEEYPSGAEDRGTAGPSDDVSFEDNLIRTLQTREDDLRVTTSIERSLSPMEIDSPLSPPSQSPISTLTNIPSLKSLPRARRVSRESSIASSSGAQDMQMSPIDFKSSLDTLIVTPLPTPFPVSTTLPQPSITHVSNGIVIPRDTFGLPQDPKEKQVEYQSKLTIPLSAEQHGTPTLPRAGPSKLPHNPFVSAGFMTEFVGAHTTSTTTSNGQVNNSPPVMPDLTTNHLIATSKASHLQPPTAPLAHRNAAASSSKTPLRPRSLVSIGVKETSPPIAPKQIPKKYLIPPSTAPPPSLPSSSGVSGQSINFTPPPDVKSLAYIPSGPPSNPLSIRSSSGMPAIQRIVPPDPKITVVAQSAAKKRVIVGTGWPFARNGFVPSSSSANSPGPPPPSNPASVTPVSLIHARSQSQLQPPPSQLQQPPSTPTSLSSTSDNASIILSYSSPSPPFNSNPVNKWNIFTSDSTPVSTFRTPPLDEKCQTPQTHLRADSEHVPPRQQASKIAPEINSLLRDGQHRTSQAKHPEYAPPPLPETAVFLFTPDPSLPQAPKINSSLPSRQPTQATRPPSSTTQLVGHSETKLPSPTAARNFLLSSYIQPTFRPLPAKPAIIKRRTDTYIPDVHGYRGVKRERGPSPDFSDTNLSRRRKRTFKWPIIENIHSVGLRGDGDLGIKAISFNSDGSQFAMSCSDRTIRIWNNHNHTEVARLANTSQIAAVSWMDNDAGVVSLGEDGVVCKWTRTGVNHWQWAKLLDAGAENRADEESMCLAHIHDRIAVAFSRTGVKVWLWAKGTWQPQRSILRQNVTSIRFVQDGEALLGGTKDGVLWYCEVPNGTLRAYAFLKARISSIDINAAGTYALVAQVGGFAHLVGIKQADNKGKVEQVYTSKETESLMETHCGFGASFANQGQTILFGSADGYLLVWDRAKGGIICGLDHGEDEVIQAVSCFDGSSSKDGYVITGTKNGQLTWWSPPELGAKHDLTNKRVRTDS